MNSLDVLVRRAVAVGGNRGVSVYDKEKATALLEKIIMKNRADRDKIRSHLKKLNEKAPNVLDYEKYFRLVHAIESVENKGWKARDVGSEDNLSDDEEETYGHSSVIEELMGSSDDRHATVPPRRSMSYPRGMNNLPGDGQAGRQVHDRDERASSVEHYGRTAYLSAQDLINRKLNEINECGAAEDRPLISNQRLSRPLTVELKKDREVLSAGLLGVRNNIVQNIPNHSSEHEVEHMVAGNTSLLQKIRRRMLNQWMGTSFRRWRIRAIQQQAAGHMLRTLKRSQRIRRLTVGIQAFKSIHRKNIKLKLTAATLWQEAVRDNVREAFEIWKNTAQMNTRVFTVLLFSLEFRVIVAFRKWKEVSKTNAQRRRRMFLVIMRRLLDSVRYCFDNWRQQAVALSNARSVKVIVMQETAMLRAQMEEHKETAENFREMNKCLREEIVVLKEQLRRCIGKLKQQGHKGSASSGGYSGRGSVVANPQTTKRLHLETNMLDVMIESEQQDLSYVQRTDYRR